MESVRAGVETTDFDVTPGLAKKWIEAARDYNSAHERDSYEFMSVWDRCITRGAPAGMFPAGYNNAYQIVQTPGYVTIHYEMIHEARIIPMDGRPHIPSKVRTYMGDARGHWDSRLAEVQVDV